MAIQNAARLRYALMGLACMLWPYGSLAQEQEPLHDDLSRGQIFSLEIQNPALIQQGPNFALPLPFTFPIDARDDSVFGVDISHHTFDQCSCTLQWNVARSKKVAFAYLKATQGSHYFDPTFKANWEAIPGRQLYRGAFHFMSSDGAPVAQAQNFMSILQGAGGLTPKDLPVSLDLEWDIRTQGGKVIVGTDGKPVDFWATVDPNEIVRRVVAWLGYVTDKTHKAPVVYTNRQWWLQRVKDESLFAQLKAYPVWIADYSTKGRGQEVPAVPNGQKSTLWQFTQVGALPGIGAPGDSDVSVDVDIFKGTLQQFSGAFGL